MRYHCSVLILVLLLVWTCDAKRHRKNNRQSSELRRSNSRVRSDVEDNSPASPRRSETNVRASTSEENRGKKKTKKHRNRSNSEDALLDAGSQDSSSVLEEKRKEVLRSTMRHMFGFDHMNAPRIPQDTSMDVEDLEGRTHTNSQKAATRNLLNTLKQESATRQRFLPDPPDFMLELYRSYSEDQTQTLINSISQGNTVRSFYSVAGESPGRPQDKGKPMIILPYSQGRKSPPSNSAGSNTNSNNNQMRVFAFNVTSIPTTESIVAAELRLNGLRNLVLENQGNELAANHSDEGWTAVIAVYRVSNPRTEENVTRNVYQRLGDFVTIRPNSSFSWVDSSIATLASSARESSHILIVKFDDGSEKELMRRKRSALGSLPTYSAMGSQSSTLELPSYFVVMSDRSKRNSGDHHRARTPTIRLSPILIVYCNDTTAKITPTSTPQVSNEMELLSTLAKFNVSSKHRRDRRSAGQRLRDDSLGPPSDEENEFPGESPRPTGESRALQDNDQTELRDNRRSERRVIQSLKDRNTVSQKRKSKKRKRGRKCRKRGRKGKKSRKCKKTPTPSPPLNKAQQICSRSSLHVDFGDMGWADWIISPKNFDAYYCSGLCEFDTMKKASPSNHAIIQAFIKAFEINTDVPSPCCVPEKLMSLSVLFFDKDDNVVLKVFPNMSVESCACR